MKLSEVIREAQAGFATGQRDPSGVMQLRMNNVTTAGALDWTSYIRVPAEAEAITRYRLQKGDVLFNNTNSTELVGKTAVFDAFREPVLFSNHFTRLRTVEDQLSPWFLAAWLRKQWLDGTFARICNRWIGQSAVQRDKLLSLEIPLPQLCEQQRIAAILAQQMAAVERARTAVHSQLGLLDALVHAYLKPSASPGPLHCLSLAECLTQTTSGIGARWEEYRLVGATRLGVAPAKEKVGKEPWRYKLVEAGTIFYNPMRILLGSIGMLDIDDQPGITSPDYVVFKTRDGVLHPRWFYFWLRSRYGEAFIKALTRGAVRERMQFRRLAGAEVHVPEWDVQQAVAVKLGAIARMKKALMEQACLIEGLPVPLLHQALSGEL